MKRVKALEEEQKKQGASLETLLKSDEKRTEREQLIVFFITRVLPATAVGTGTIVSALVWAITHFH